MYVLGMLAALGFVAPAAHAAPHSQQHIVRVGIYENPPKLLLDSQARPGGIMGELLLEIAKREGWALEAVQCDWQQCLNALQNDLLDIVPGLAYSPERAALYSFHSRAVLEDWSQIFTGKTTHIGALNDLNGKRIAVMSGTLQLTQLYNILQKLELGSKLVITDSQYNALKLVQSKQADAAVVGHLFGVRHAGEHGLKTAPIRLEPTNTYFVTAKDRHLDLLAAIDTHIKQWQDNNDPFYTETLNQWGLRLIEKPTKPWIIPALLTLGVLLTIALLTVTLMRIGLRRQRKKLVRTEHHLHTVLDAIDAYVYIKDDQFRYQYANRKLCEDLNYTTVSIVGKTDQDLYANKQTINEFRHNDEQVLYSG
ncbi:transporter substrate-binding domain-containing protein [Alcaligenes nematophilus]|uniref:Transporter substrate-binding domain-containing protein n=2 Tax=Alcaligenes nematophilus TaxID=2994643 RepID=A0ABU3MYI2_9BURK|nr:transporter substrate-binding domain-containing protein [Alcaligenes nematophilus]MDT8466064.1 transporter substrate-binding domain-containing protein [Alcaligenes nematophilus]MDT8469779.1 transporter substrate-binding domain-containing protein [Alcaligenes nematophilus]MDT8506038.1 transporter substrate-binding domain-containing protein [Alcaligenes nematophilus]MDT8526493.1 transporter substrate-binding domain-containing protein [Alcaligenes nematophilus]